MICFLLRVYGQDKERGNLRYAPRYIKLEKIANDNHSRRKNERKNSVRKKPAGRIR